MNIFRKSDRATWSLGGALYYNSPFSDIRKKIDAGADVDGEFSNGHTRKSFLGWAASLGRVEALRLLLEKGAKPDPREGMPAPLLEAISNREGECTVALIEAGADVNFRRGNENPPLLVAVRNGMGDIVKLLLDKGAEVNVQSSSGNTALHIAAEKGFANIVALLIEKGADAKMTNGNLNTPADMAEREYPGLAAMIRGTSDGMLKSAETAAEWQLLTPNEIARVTVRDKIGYRITEIFNFSARTYAHIACNLESKAESQALKSFMEIDGELIEKAHAELLRQGGSARSTGIKKKLSAPGLQ